MKYHEKTFALQQKLFSSGADRVAEKIYSKNSGALLEWEDGHMIEYHLFDKR